MIAYTPRWLRIIWMRTMASPKSGALWCCFCPHRGNGCLAVDTVLFIVSRALDRSAFQQDQTLGCGTVISGKSLGAVFWFFWQVLTLKTVIFVFLMAHSQKATKVFIFYLSLCAIQSASILLFVSPHLVLAASLVFWFRSPSSQSLIDRVSSNLGLWISSQSWYILH